MALRKLAILVAMMGFLSVANVLAQSPSDEPEIGMFHQKVPYRQSVFPYNVEITSRNQSFPSDESRYSFGIHDCVFDELFLMRNFNLDTVEGTSRSFLFYRNKFSDCELLDNNFNAPLWFVKCSFDNLKVHNVKYEGTFSIQYSQVKSLKWDSIGSIGDFTFFNDDFYALELSGANVSNLYFKNDTFHGQTSYSNKFNGINHMQFHQCLFKDSDDFRMEIDPSSENKLRRVDFEESHFEGGLYFAANVPDTLFLIRCRFDRPQQLPTSNKPGRVLYLGLVGTDVSLLKFEYKSCHLIFDFSTSYDEQCAVYGNLLEKFKTEGRTESYENVDIEYQEFRAIHNYGAIGRLINGLQRYWWNHGYSKWYVLFHFFFFISLFSVINIFNWERLQHVYSFENIQMTASGETPARKGDKRRRYLSKLYVSLLYTTLIFCIIKIDIPKLKIDKKGAIFLFFLEYALGLLLIGYIANFVFNK